MKWEIIWSFSNSNLQQQYFSGKNGFDVKNINQYNFNIVDKKYYSHTPQKKGHVGKEPVG